MHKTSKWGCSLLHYVAAALFLLTPLFSGAALEGPQAWIPLGTGVLLAGATFAARDRIGPARMIDGPMRQVIELGGATVLALSPWLFAFADLTWRPHLLVGQVGIGVSILTQTVEELPPGVLSRLRRAPRPRGTAQAAPASPRRAARAPGPSDTGGRRSPVAMGNEAGLRTSNPRAVRSGR